MSSAGLQRAFSRDHLLRGFTPSLRASFAQATLSAESGRLRWGITDPRASILYGRAVVGAALLSANLKGEERAILQFVGRDNSNSSSSSNTDGISRLYAEAVATGEVRASASGYAIESGDKNTKKKDFRWDGRLHGTFSVTRILYGSATPVQGIVEATAGDVEGDLASYFLRSEQRRAHVKLEVNVNDTTGQILFAGGSLIEAIADSGGITIRNDDSSSSSSSLEHVEKILKKEPPSFIAAANTSTSENIESDDRSGGCSEFSYGRLFSAGISLAHAASQVIPEFSHTRVISGAAPGAARGAGVLERIPLDFFCRCTKTRFIEKLILTLSSSSLDDMIHESKGGVAAQLTCAFCNSTHNVTTEELNTART